MPDHQPPDRWIELTGVVNMRDLGGLPTRDGGRTAYGRVIRSDNLQDLSPADVIELVDRRGVTDILDLRTEAEVEAEGAGPLWRVGSLRHHHHSLIERLAAPAAGIGAVPAGPGAPPGSAWNSVAERPVVREGVGLGRDAAFWAEHYRGYLERRADSVAAALRVIAASPGATIVHCAAGKDRTGTVVALLLDAVGVEHEAIIEDYVSTAGRLQRIIGRLMSTETYAPALRLQVIEDQLPRPESMATILEGVRADHGGGANWLRAHGWTDDEVQGLRARLLES